MKFILLVLTTISSLSVSATVTCHDGAMSEAFGLFQSKNVCTHKNLDYIFTTYKRTKDNCESGFKSYEEYASHNCHYGDDSACAKAKKSHHVVDTGNESIKLHGKDLLNKRFQNVIAKIQDTKEALKMGGRSIASIDHHDFTQVIVECEDAFKTFHGEMKAWREEHPVVRKRSIRVRAR